MISYNQKDESPVYKPFGITRVGLGMNMGMGMTSVEPQVMVKEGNIVTNIFVVDKRFKEGTENRLSDFQIDLNNDVAVLREKLEERYEQLGVKLPQAGYYLSFKNMKLMPGVSLKNAGVKHWSDICIERQMLTQLPQVTRINAYF